MQTNQKYLNNFIDNLEGLFKEVERGIEKKEWSFKYDDISDILYFYPKNKKVSQDSILIPAGDSGISARIGIGGIEAFVIEEFGDVFIQENQEFKPLYTSLTQRDEKTGDTLRRGYTLLLNEFKHFSLGQSALAY